MVINDFALLPAVTVSDVGLVWVVESSDIGQALSAYRLVLPDPRSFSTRCRRLSCFMLLSKHDMSNKWIVKASPQSGRFSPCRKLHAYTWHASIPMNCQKV